MSRSYRISVSESVRRVVCVEDHVQTQLEMLDILPEDEMADLLAEELVQRGFHREGDMVVRVDGKTRVSVDLKSGTVTVSRETSEELEEKGKREGRSYDQRGPDAKRTRNQLKQQLNDSLEKKIDDQRDKIQREVTEALEAELADLRQELDQAANRATAEALKQKASRIGQIKELTEDPESGSLTIVVEV